MIINTGKTAAASTSAQKLNALKGKTSQETNVGAASGDRVINNKSNNIKAVTKTTKAQVSISYKQQAEALQWMLQRS